VRAAEVCLSKGLPGGVRIISSPRKNDILKAENDIWTLMFWGSTVEPFANQNPWSICKIVRHLGLLPGEGDVIYMFVPAEEYGIADGSSRFTHYAGYIIGRASILRVVDISQEDMPRVVMVTVSGGVD